MAGKNDKGKAGAGAASGGNGAAAAAGGPPSGYRQMSADTDAPWWKAEEGAICHGELLGMYTMQGVDPARSYYQLRLLEPTLGWKGKGDDREEVSCEKGSIINLGENYKVQELRRVIPQHTAGARYNIYVRIKGAKVKVGAGHTMWPMDVFSKMLEPPKGPVVSNVELKAATGSQTGDDDVPF